MPFEIKLHFVHISQPAKHANPRMNTTLDSNRDTFQLKVEQTPPG